MTRYAIVAITCALLCSCSPQTRLNHLIKRHPELAIPDTIRVSDLDTSAAINESVSFRADTNINGLDSLFEQLRGKVDSLLAMKLKGEVRNHIVNRPLFPDTITKTVDGVTFKIYQNGSEVGISFYKPQEVMEETHEVIGEKIKVEPLTWYERAWLKAKDFLIMLLLGAVLVMIYITRKRSPL